MATITLCVWVDAHSDSVTLNYPDGITNGEAMRVADGYVRNGKADAVHVLEDGRPVSVHLSDSFRGHISEVTGMTPEQIQAFSS